MSIFVVGDENAILGFSMIGVEGKVAKSTEEARAALEDAVAREEIEIVLVTENWAAEMRERVDQLKMETAKPLVLDIPGSTPAPSGRSLREFVEEAVGVRLSHESGR